MDNYQQQVLKIIEQALNEDSYKEDYTNQNILDNKKICSGAFIARTSGVVSGIEVVCMIFHQLNNKIKIRILKESGSYLNRGDVIASIEGPIRDILRGERVALNFLQRLSGIASTTNRFVKEVVGTECKIIDSRSNAPNLRILERRAVIDGGGYNDYSNQSERLALTINHLGLVPSIKKAVEQMASTAKEKKLLIEVEVDNRQDFLEAMSTDCDIIRLRNFSDEELVEMISINDHYKTLIVAGNIALAKARQIALTGVEYLSIDNLALFPRAIDIDLKFYRL